MLSIAALHGAVTLAWVVYNLYLVQLLLRAGFDAYLAPVLLIIEGILGAALEPLMGGISDRSRRRRLSLVAGGVLTAGIAFVAFPLTASAASGLARLLPALVLGWASAMALFRAPALSLLSRHARPQALPLAASVLTATAGLVGAAAPSARAWILSFGPGPTFAVASSALLLSAGVLMVLERRSPTTGEDAGQPRATDGADPSGAGRAWLLFAVGTSVALASRALLDGLPRAGAGPGAPAAAIATAFFLGTAIASIPLGILALGRAGGGRVAAGGLAVLVLGAGLPLAIAGAAPVLACAAVLGAGAAAVQNGLFATSLTAVRGERPGLGMGLLLGGGGLALSLFNAMLAVRKPAPATSLLAAAVLYALTLLLLRGLQGARRAVAIPG
ncbi:MAG: hypothetical protein ACXU81_08630 [Myxococcaceae bacterium]